MRDQSARRWTWLTSFTIAAGGVMGCQSHGPLHGEAQAYALESAYERQLVQAKDYLQSEGFQIDRFDLRALSLTTQPQRLPQTVDTLRVSQGTFSDFSEGLFAGTQRRVRVQREQDRWLVEVYLQRPHHATTQLTHAINARPNRLDAVPDEWARNGHSGQDWQTTRRDPALEARIHGVLAQNP